MRSSPGPSSECRICSIHRRSTSLYRYLAGTGTDTGATGRQSPAFSSVLSVRFFPSLARSGSTALSWISSQLEDASKEFNIHNGHQDDYHYDILMKSKEKPLNTLK